MPRERVNNNSRFFNIIKTAAILSCAGFLFFGFTINAQAANYYVSTTGNDSNAGTSASPWRTIQKAANTMVAGDTAIVNTGTYNERVSVSTSGSSGNLITFRANPLNAVTCNGFTIVGNYVRVEGFNINGVNAKKCDWSSADFGIAVYGDYNQIVNNYIYDSGYAGIRTYGDSNNSTISDNKLARNGDNGMLIHGYTHLISNNEIYDTRCAPCNSDDANGIIFQGGGHTFSSNYIHDITHASNPGCSPHIDAFQTYDGSVNGPGYEAPSNIILEKNHVVLLSDTPFSETAPHCFMLEGGVHNIVIKNNIFECYAGINTGLASEPPATNLKIFNNIWRSSLTFTGPYSSYGMNLNSIGSTGEIYNNILVDFKWNHFYMGNVNYNYGNNLMWNSDGSSPGLLGYMLQSTDKRGVDPKFVINFTDLHLQSSSPAKDAGTTIASVTNDYAGIARPQGSAYDLGAYEYVSGGGDTTPPSTPTNLTAIAISSSQINLFWTASTDNVGVTGYNIYRCTGLSCMPSTQLTTATSTLYSNTGLSANTIYIYAVSAYDAASNESAKSASVSTSTPAIPDTTPPAAPTGVAVN